jgi:DNA polymerase-3 subunit delta
MAKGQSYLFTGPELGEREDAIQNIKQSLTKMYGTAPEEQSFYAGETSVSEMVSFLRNGSLFSDARLIIIKNVEQIRKKEDVELLAAYIEKSQENTTLICTSDEISVDKKLEQSFPRENKHIFWELFENRKSEWVASFFKREGFTITADGIEAILELVENNTDALRKECSRLVLFLNKECSITEEEVEQCLSHTREESAFTLFSYIAQKDLSKSLEVLHTLLDSKQSSHVILSGLIWCFRKLQEYEWLLSTSSATEVELKKIGLASKKALKDYIQASKKYSKEDIDRALKHLAECDLEIRASSSVLEYLLMEICIYRIICSSAIVNNIFVF